MLVGLFGGTFNPIHNGHLMVARQVFQHFSLDCLYIIPCRLPPHKQQAFLAPVSQRVTMIERALPDDDRYRISDVEINRSGPSYTIDTIDHFRTSMETDVVLFLPLGMDAFLEIHTWKSYARVLASVQPVVVTRFLDEAKDAPNEIQGLDRYIRSRLSDSYRLDATRSCWQKANGSSIHLLSVAPMTVSSSLIRERIQERKSIAGLVPSPVDAYIEKKELYR